MKFNKARIIAAGAAAMMAVMSAPVIPTMAAVTYGNGKITIEAGEANTDSKTNQSVTYKGFYIFKANVEDDDSGENTTGKTETNVNWANDNVKTAVENVIKEEDSSYTGTTAQDAADFIISKITGTVNTTRVDADSFADKLAHAVDGLTETTTLTPGTQSGNLDEGWWLFTTDKSKTDDQTDLTGTAPIFAIVGGSDVTVTEKTSIPTVDKKVIDDKDDAEEGVVADSQMDQEISYRLTGTVADNIGTFDTYKYKFTDTLPKGMTVNAESVKAYAVNGSSKVELKVGANAEDTTGYTVTLPSGSSDDLVINFADLKKVNQKDGQTAPTINKDTSIVVEYTAKLDPSKADSIVYGGSGNQNTVKITYSNNPYSEGTGESTSKTSTDYSYKLKLHKIDRSTEVNLQNAKFTIQATTPDDDGSKDKYVQGNGSLGSEAYEFTTDENGEISVSGLDAGTYTVTETTSPDGYDKVDTFTFEIKPTYSGESLTSLENVLTATDSVIGGSTDGDTSDNVIKAGTKNDAADASTGTVLITVGDKKRGVIPLTGQGGILAMISLGGIAVAVGVIAYRKKDDEDSAAKA